MALANALTLLFDAIAESLRWASAASPGALRTRPSSISLLKGLIPDESWEDPIEIGGIVTDGGAPRGAGVIEIRPVTPPGRLGRGTRMLLAKWRLRVDPASGTLTLTEDVGPTRTFALPALPAAVSPGAVATVTLARYRWVRNLQTGVSFRLLFLDRDGKALHIGKVRFEEGPLLPPPPRASVMWPRDLFAPLETLGIAVTEEEHASIEAFRKAHPDVQTFDTVSEGKIALIGVGIALLLIVTIGVVVYLNTH